jgi:hypothetical protein
MTPSPQARDPCAGNPEAVNSETPPRVTVRPNTDRLPTLAIFTTRRSETAARFAPSVSGRVGRAVRMPGSRSATTGA